MLCSSGYVLQDSKHIKIPVAGFGLLKQTFGLVRFLIKVFSEGSVSPVRSPEPVAGVTHSDSPLSTNQRRELVTPDQ